MRRSGILGLLGVVLLAGHGRACEPVVPLMQIFSGVFLMSSFIVLGVAVLVKAAAFVFFERRLNWLQAMAFMVVANIVSSLVGFLLAGAAGVPPMALLSLPIVYILSLVPAKRFMRFGPWKDPVHFSPHIVAIAAVVLFVVTFILFGLAQGILLSGESASAYWGMKFLYIVTALTISIGLTTMWEEWVVSELAGKGLAGTSFYPSVLKANLLTLLLIMGYAAAVVLPHRLNAPGFLVQLGVFISAG